MYVKNMLYSYAENKQNKKRTFKSSKSYNSIWPDTMLKGQFNCVSFFNIKTTTQITCNDRRAKMSYCDVHLF